MAVTLNAANGDAFQSDPWTGGTVLAGNYTIACNINLTDLTTSDWDAVVIGYVGGSYSELKFDRGSGNKWQCFITDDAQANFYAAIDTTTVTSGQSYHIASTWDGTTLRFFLNGGQTATLTPGAFTRTASALNLFYAPADMTGGLQDVVFYNGIALSADEIAGLAAARMPRRRDGLIQWHPMNSVADAATNYSGNPLGVTTLVKSGTPGSSTGPSVSWGTKQSTIAMRSPPATATATANMGQSGSAAAAAASLANMKDAGAGSASAASLGAMSDAGAASASAAAVGGMAESGLAVATSFAAAAANMNASAAAAAAAASGANMNEFGTASGALAAANAGMSSSGSANAQTSGGGGSGPYGYAHSLRRPPNTSNRRGLR